MARKIVTIRFEVDTEDEPSVEWRMVYGEPVRYLDRHLQGNGDIEVTIEERQDHEH